MSDDESDFDVEWDGSLAAASVPVITRGELLDDDIWETRYNEDTTGYVSDPLTTSFTDLDLDSDPEATPPRSEISAQWAELDSWLDA